jgi:hypothetical protein
MTPEQSQERLLISSARKPQQLAIAQLFLVPCLTHAICNAFTTYYRELPRKFQFFLQNYDFVVTYSARMAVIGSTRSARKAGQKLPANVVKIAMLSPAP